MFVERFVDTGGNRKYTVLLSIAAHTFAITAAIIVPLVATDTIVLPTRSAMMAFYSRPPLPPSLPPPKGIVRAQVPAATLTVPPEIPQQIAPESPIRTTAGSLADFGYNAGIITGGDVSIPTLSQPPPPVQADAPVPVGGDIKRPMKLREVAPTYPPMARAAHVEGIVIIQAVIGPDGKVQDARVIRSNPLLGAAALDAVRQWEFTPTLLNGIPIAVLMTVTVDFRLR
jgi:protein TonB